jgi:replicative DNA helicase
MWVPDNDDLAWLKDCGPMAEDDERWVNKAPQPAIRSGLDSVDSLLEGGFRKGQVIVVSALTGHGKSAFGLTAARNSAEAGKPAMIFTHEMSREMMYCRACQQITGIPANRIQDKEVAGQYELTAQNRADLEPARAHIRSIPLHTYCGDMINAQNVAYIMKTLVDTFGIELFVFDYIQRMVHEDKPAKIGELMAAISNCAKNIVNVPVIVLAQLNRGIDKPCSDNIKDSAAIKHEADACFVLTPDHEKPWDHLGVDFTLDLDKQRAGGSGTRTIRFVPYKVEFTDVTRG